MYTPSQLLVRLFAIGLFGLGYWLFDGFAVANHYRSGEVGFLSGLWHGAVWPVALICSLFDKNTVICASYGNGWQYNFGFGFSYLGWFFRWFLLPHKHELDPGIVEFNMRLDALIKRFLS